MRGGAAANSAASWTSATHTGVDGGAALVNLQRKLHQHFRLQGDSTCAEGTLHLGVGSREEEEEREAPSLWSGPASRPLIGLHAWSECQRSEG